MTEDRQSSREPVKSQSTEAEKPERQARRLPGAVQGTSSRGETSPQGRKRLGLGMTQDEVRRTLGEPSSIENAGAYVFWQYSEMSNQKYVIFGKLSGQVTGWRGL